MNSEEVLHFHCFYVILRLKGGDSMKKKVLICVFLSLIFVTVVAFITMAVGSYRYDMDPANGVDIMEGWGAFYIAVSGFFVVLYELDLFYTVYYFACQPRTKLKSLLNILGNGSFLLVFFAGYLPEAILGYRMVEYGIEVMRLVNQAPMFALLLYVWVRITYAIVSVVSARRAKQKDT